MTIRARDEIVMPMESVQLIAKFRDGAGNFADLDAFPQISIVQPSGTVLMAPTSAGVFRLDIGTYGYILPIPYAGPLGVWTDIWTGQLNGFNIYGSFNFAVVNTQVPNINSDGYIALGDDVPFNYSQNGLWNMNKIIKVVRARLNSRGKALVKDEFGNEYLEDCDIFSVDQLATFVANSFSAFNEIPHFTNFTIEDTEFVNQFLDVLAQHAVYYALASKALIERGREYTVADGGGVNLVMPSVADLLNTQYTTELQNWFEKIKLIKASMKPQAMGLGTMSSIGQNRMVNRLRHLRARQIF